MKNCWHVREKHYIDGSVQGYIDPKGVLMNDPEGPQDVRERKPSRSDKVLVLNPFLAGDDEYTISHPFSNGNETAYMEYLTPMLSKEIEERRDEQNRKRATRRAVQTVEDISRSHVWRYFVTLTISPDSGLDRYSYEDVLTAVELFLKNLRRRFLGIRYIFVPEQHKDGAFHYHGLIGGCDMSAILTDSGKKRNHKSIYNFSAGWSYGFSTVSIVQKQGAVGRYIGKYITKDMSVPKGKKRYLSSNNVKRTADITVKKRISCCFSDEASLCEAICSGFFTNGIVPDRIRPVYVAVLDRTVYYYEIYGSEEMICA